MSKPVRVLYYNSFLNKKLAEGLLSRQFLAAANALDAWELVTFSGKKTPNLNGHGNGQASKPRKGARQQVKKVVPASVRQSVRYVLSPISPYPIGPYLYSRKMAQGVDLIAAQQGPFDVLLLRTAQSDLRVLAEMSANAQIPVVVAAGGPLAYQADHVFHRNMSQADRDREQFLYERADAITVISEDMKQMLVDTGIAEQKIFPIPNGVDFGSFDPNLGDDSLVRRELGLENCRVVGYVGGYWSGHDMPCLLRAWQQVEPMVDDAVLLLVGDGPFKESAQRLSVELGLARCVWVGHVQHEAIPNYMAAMDVAVGPYVQESLAFVSPLKIIEYLAMGLCVVATQGGQVSELIESGVSGFTYEAGNSDELASGLLDLLASPELILQMGAAARQRIENWRSWDDVAQDVLTICLDVVNAYEAA